MDHTNPIILVAEDNPDLHELWKAQIEGEKSLSQFEFRFTTSVQATILQFILSRNSIALIALDGILLDRLNTFQLPNMFRQLGYTGPIIAMSSGHRDEQIQKGCDPEPSCHKKDLLVSVITKWVNDQ